MIIERGLSMNIFEKILLTIIQICTFLCYLPQIIKTIKLKKSKDVAITSWIISMISALCYTIYGIITKDSFIIFTCITEVLLAIISIIFLIKYKDNCWYNFILKKVSFLYCLKN